MLELNSLHYFTFVDLSELKNLLIDAEEKHFPDSDLMQQLNDSVTEASKCANVASQLVSKKVRTRLVYQYKTICHTSTCTIVMIKEKKNIANTMRVMDIKCNWLGVFEKKNI